MTCLAAAISAEGRVEHLDVLGEVGAVLEVELVLAALLGRAGGDVAVLGGVVEDGGAELLVHQDAGLGLRHAAGDGRLEAVVDDLLGGGDLCRRSGGTSRCAWRSRRRTRSRTRPGRSSRPGRR